jgi:hypothetical protein
MTQKFAYRFASLVLFTCFAAASIGGDGCFDGWSTPPTAPSSPTAACPSAGDHRYTCTVVVTEVKSALCHTPIVAQCQASFGWTPCAATTTEAETMTTVVARMKAQLPSFVLKPTCTTFSLYDNTPILNDLALDGSCTCTDGTGGSSTTGGSCVSTGDACTADADCCSSMCSEQGVCEACRGDLEGCVNNADCCSGICSLNACGGNGLHLHDGGLGFQEEGSP